LLRKKKKDIKSQQYLSAQEQANEMYLYDLKTLVKNEQYLSYWQNLFASVRGFMDSESCSVAWDTNLLVASSYQQLRNIFSYYL